MEIEYELTKEDFLDFNLNHAHNSNTVKKSLFYQRYIISIIFLIVPVILSKTFKAPAKSLLPPFLIAFFIWIIFYPNYFWWHIKRNLVKVFDESKNSGLTGVYSLTTNKEEIVSKSESKEIVRDWGSVQRIEKTDKNVLIYTSPVEAIIIPLRAFDDEESLKRFLEVIEKFSGKILNDK